jgi:hypothetical protein
MVQQKVSFLVYLLSLSGGVQKIITSIQRVRFMEAEFALGVILAPWKEDGQTPTISAEIHSLFLCFTLK